MPHHGDIDGAPGPGSRLKLKQPQAEPERTPVTQIPSVLCLCVSFGSFGLFLGVKLRWAKLRWTKLRWTQRS